MSVDLDVRDGIAYVTLNRPDVLNALDLAMLNALDDAWHRIEDDPSVRVAILTGAGDRAFSAGGDLKEFAPDETPIAETYPAFFPALTKPLIAAVNGLAYGGGTELLGLCDLRVAADHATFSLMEVTRGLFPAGGSVVRFARELPWPLAMELLITGRPITADVALRWGLVNRVVPAAELMAAAEEYARAVIACAPTAGAAIKAAAAASIGIPLDDAFAASLTHQRRVLASPEAAEGVAAFLERRPPRWGAP